MDRNLTEGRFKAYDHSEWHKCKWRSLPWHVSEGRTATVYRRDRSWMRISLLFSPGSNALRRVTLSSFWRRPEWPPWNGMTTLPTCPSFAQQRTFGALWSRRYIEEAGWVLWSKTKKKNCHSLEQNRPRSAAHHDEGGWSARALCIP